MNYINALDSKKEIKIMVRRFSSTTRSNRRTRNGSEPRGRSGGLGGRCKHHAAKHTPSLAGATDSAPLQQSRQRPLGSQYILRRHFSANPFGLAAQRGVEQAKLMSSPVSNFEKISLDICT